MSTWLALLVSPSLVLLDVTLAHALATPSCATQQEAEIRYVLLTSLALSFVFTLLAWRDATTPHGHGPPAGGRADGSERHAFMARVALGVGALSTLTIAALTIPAWLLSPCTA